MEGVDAVACEILADLLASVADATLDQGLVPIENAIEGTVSATIDGLVFDHELVIVQEIVIPIRLHLLARPGVALDDVTSVRSYVHALAQCRAYLHDLDVTIEQTTSTSQAAREVAESSGAVGRGRPRRSPANSSASSALATDIEDHPGNATRFVVVGRDARRGTHGTRPHDHRLLPRRRPPRLALRHPRSFRRARHQPHEVGEPPDETRTRRLLLRHRVRGSRRRGRRRRLPRRPTGAPGAREVPRLVSGDRARRHRSARGGRRGPSHRPTSGFDEIQSRIDS